MLTCKQVSKSLEKGDYQRLPLASRLGLKLHVALCVVCHKYNKQRMVMHDIFRKFRQREERGETLLDVHLSQDARSRMHDSICCKSKDGDPPTPPSP